MRERKNSYVCYSSRLVIIVDLGAINQEKGYEKRVNLVDYERKELMRSNCAVLGCSVRSSGKEGQHGRVVKRAEVPSNGVIMIAPVP